MVLQQWMLAILCGVEQRASPVFGRAAITLGISPHFSLSMELDARNGYSGSELLPGYPVNVVNVKFPTG